MQVLRQAPHCAQVRLRLPCFVCLAYLYPCMLLVLLLALVGTCCRVYTHRPPAHAPRLRVDSFKDIFKMQICVENCSPKPSPKPVQLALQVLGDPADDVVAGASADAQALGVVKPRACRSTDPLARERRHLQPRTQWGESRARVADGRRPHVRDAHALRTSSSSSRAPRA